MQTSAGTWLEEMLATGSRGHAPPAANKGTHATAASRPAAAGTGIFPPDILRSAYNTSAVHSMLTRRDFGKIALAGAAVARRAAAGSAIRIGADTRSFHDFPRIPGRDNVDEVISALQAAGVAEIDLASENTEAPSPDTGLPPPPPPGP